MSSACRVSCLSRLTPVCIDDLPDEKSAANQIVFNYTVRSIPLWRLKAPCACTEPGSSLQPGLCSVPALLPGSPPPGGAAKQPCQVHGCLPADTATGQGSFSAESAAAEGWVFHDRCPGLASCQDKHQQCAPRQYPPGTARQHGLTSLRWRPERSGLQMLRPARYFHLAEM